VWWLAEGRAEGREEEEKRRRRRRPQDESNALGKTPGKIRPALSVESIEHHSTALASS
jgi:hypothetical protein